MEIYLENKKKSFKPALSFVAGVVILFVSTLLFMPAAGLLRTLPILVFAGAVCEMLKMSLAYSLLLTGVFNLCMYLVYSGNVGESLVYSVVAVALVFAGLYSVKLIRHAKKTAKTAVRKKCTIFCVAAVVAAVAVSFVFCGNPVSFLKHESNNEARVSFINEHFGDDCADKQFTAYDLKSGNYRTYIEFKHDGNIVGADNECYISTEKGIVTDCMRDYYEARMLDDAKKNLATAVMNATTAFEITAADIEFENNELLGADALYEDYSERIGYVVSFYSIIDNKNDFHVLCKDVLSCIKEQGISFDEIAFCAGTASDVLYSLKVDSETDSDSLSSRVCLFDEKHFSRYGINKENILDYWYNN